MLFTLMAAAAAPQALSLRPAVGTGARSASFAKLSDLVKATRSDSLQEVAGVVNEILLQQGNATEHLSTDETNILRQIIDEIIPNAMYGSMTRAQTADETRLSDAIDAINQCYQDFGARVSVGGDIRIFHDHAISLQNDLNEIKDDCDAKTTVNETKCNDAYTHMILISDPPSCPGLPDPRTMPSLDVYFEANAYVAWFTAQSAAWGPIHDACKEAGRQLDECLDLYGKALAVRDVAYCDWKRELEAGCADFSACYEEQKARYLNVVKPNVEENMKMRIENFKAGETIIHQIKFLLAEVADQAQPSINTARYQMAFPEVPAKPACDMSALDDAMWVPMPVCPDGCHENVDVGHRQDGYRGCQTHSQTGHLCRQWNDHWITTFPHKGLGEHNFCRNPDHEPDGIWCFKVSGGWEYCNPVVPMEQLLNGCTRDATTLSGWGSPRLESADQRAGEAICCDSAGQATRHVHDGSATFGATSHEICTTPNGNRLFEGDGPSYTFFEAKALCEGAGLSLCSTQAQLDSTCGTGCWLNTVLIWVE